MHTFKSCSHYKVVPNESGHFLSSTGFFLFIGAAKQLLSILDISTLTLKHMDALSTINQSVQQLVLSFFFCFAQMKDNSLQKNGTNPHWIQSRVEYCLF